LKWKGKSVYKRGKKVNDEWTHGNGNEKKGKIEFCVCVCVCGAEIEQRRKSWRDIKSKEH
jgi:hypothetical protein